MTERKSLAFQSTIKPFLVPNALGTYTYKFPQMQDNSE
ncbi:MAG: hypothetical protein HW401_145 [Parcubacteria group bacterium]|nr:hypothetical protein [Parcubacteria group bacterium]